MSDTALHGTSVPTALMALIHTKDGQPYQRFGPARCAAVAEILELSVRGDIDIDVDGHTIVGATVTHDGPAWVGEVTTTLADAVARRPITISSWLGRRPRAYALHRDQAVADGVLVRGRARLLGVPYRTTIANPTKRSEIVDALTSPARDVDPRVSALASIVVASGITSVLGVGADDERRLKDVASGARWTGMTATMVAALATVGYLAVIGG